MTTEVHVKNYNSSEDTGLRSMEVKLHNKFLITPLKAIVTNNFYKDTSIDFHNSVIGEQFIRFDDNKLKKFGYDNSYSGKIQRKCNTHKQRLGDKFTNLTLIEYKTEDIRIPTNKEIKRLINISYPYSDITPIPSIPKFTRKINIDNYDLFIKYIDECISLINIHNHKHIMGYVPLVAPAYIDGIIEKYLDHGINSYYIDFDGTTLGTNKSQIDAMKRILAQRGYEENHFIHYINISYGKAIDDIKVLSARDMLAYGCGLDSLGGVHTGPKRNRGFYEWIKEQKPIDSNSNRLFSKDKYGYFKIDTISKNDSFPNSTVYNFDGVMESSIYVQKRMLNIINLQEQLIEANNLVTIVKEKGTNTAQYFLDKECVKEKDVKGLLVKK